MKLNSLPSMSIFGLQRRRDDWIFPIVVHVLLLFSGCLGSGIPGSEHTDYTSHPRFICTPIPADADPACFPPGAAPGAGGPGMSGHHSGHHSGPGASSSAWWGMSEEAKATILHLRESLVQQKETILDQRETIRELTAKLTLCQGFGHTLGSHDSDHHRVPPHLAHHTYGPTPEGSHHGYAPGTHTTEPNHYGHHRGKAALGDKYSSNDLTPSPSSTPEQMGRMLTTLKERLENLQTRNSSTTYSSSLKDLLQRKIAALELQMLHHTTSPTGTNHHDSDEDDDDDHPDGHHDSIGHDNHSDGSSEHHVDDHEHHDGQHDGGDRHDDSQDHHDSSYDDVHRDNGEHEDSHHDNEAAGHSYPRMSYHSQGHSGQSKLDAVLNHLTHRLSETGSRKKGKSSAGFQIGFPMRTNYMYGRIKRTLLHEIFALTLCLWMKGGAGPGLGTPFSYSVPGQANELVLIEWGNNPMELLINDRAVTLPLSLSDGKWHHVCVTWSTRDGLWEAYQDGVKRGSGENLSAWHPIKPGGVFILGQEQDTLGGRFDATQAFVGEISDLQLWSHVLTPHDIYSLASCGGHMTGDIIAWAESVVELHGGVTKYPFDPCH
ncbi:neuronal pentraxin-2 [Salminus brasiliensis]|uniref:neuronal pentraxin-2 n=1 Tax=Salminus brasiliensis TaxID=930266 RepID=UPI003B837748